MNKVRIIGGKWRSRRLDFPNQDILRPTPDRVRETLFNWLATDIIGANCLDCFAGSGALGFEALSRGAAYVTMIDKSRLITEYLKKNAISLDASNLDIHCATFPTSAYNIFSNLEEQKPLFDIVFLDPPYRNGLIEICCAWLEEKQYLKPKALIYIEAERNLSPLPIPKNWHILKSQKTGQVGYHLVKNDEL